MQKSIWWVLPLLTLSASIAETQIPEEQFLLRFRSASQNCLGASAETKTRIAATLGAELLLKPVEIRSAIVTGFGRAKFMKLINGTLGISDEMNTQFGASIGYSVDGCGRWVAAASSVGLVLNAVGVAPTQFENARGFETEFFRTVHATKSYQDVSVGYRLILPPNISLDNFREGQKISLKGTSVGNDGRTILIVDTVLTETVMLRCPNGHEYAPAAGYKFCPIDGKPLSGG